jgi:CNT family concentrative nucleoside transporter
MYNLISFIGMFILMGVAWVFSSAKRAVNMRVIAWGLGLQLVFAFFLFLVPVGTKVFLFVNDAVVRVLDSATAGSQFVFGALAAPPGSKTSLGFILAFQAFPTIIFFSALVSLLYYFNIMPRIIRFFAKLFTRLMNISGAESLASASNIFVGVESAFTIKPHIKDMTPSELCTVLTSGMATVASNVLALYVFTLQGQFPTIAGHLISASFLSAPAAIIMSKILLPETGHPVTRGQDIVPHYERESNFFEAIINGSYLGVKVIVSVVALLIAILGLVALFDMILGYAGDLFYLKISLRSILGYIFYPLTIILGIPMQDVGAVARLIGERVVLTEVVAYQDLAKLMADHALSDSRSAVIATYALCGFAHVASMAIFVGGVAALAPERTQDITRVAFRALCAATLACLMTACIAGVFYRSGSILLGG